MEHKLLLVIATGSDEDLVRGIPSDLSVVAARNVFWLVYSKTVFSVTWNLDVHSDEVPAGVALVSLDVKLSSFALGNFLIF